MELITKFVNDNFYLDQADLLWSRGSVTSNPNNPPSLRACIHYILWEVVPGVYHTLGEGLLA